MKKIWDKDKIAENLKTLYEKENLKASYVKKNHSSLYSACRNNFDSYKDAVEYAGIDYTNIKMSFENKKIEFINKANELKISGKLKHSILVSDFKNFHNMINYYFGTIANFLDFMELSYSEYNDGVITKWSKDLVIMELTKLKNEDRLAPNYLYKNNSKLMAACRRYFGNYENALREINISYDDVKIQKTWDKENIKDSLLKVYNNGKVNMNSSYMLKKHCDLHHACINHFGSYEEALKSIGLNLKEFSNIAFNNSVIKSKKWSEDIIKDELKKIYDEGMLSDGYIRNFRGDLHSACYSYFGGLNEALSCMGIIYDEILDNNLSLLGFKFERLLGKIFDKVGVKYNKKQMDGLRPDFRLENGVWIDAKLSQWTYTIDSTISKYKDHCNELIIIYLRGYNEETIREDNVKVISVYKYLDDLGINKDSIVYEWLDSLKIKIENKNNNM